MATLTAPAPHSHNLCAAHSHGLDDIAGYVVTITRLDATTGITSREDVAMVTPSTNYGKAVEMANTVRHLIRTGEIDATYAVIDTVYQSGCRPV